ncbi:MAG: tyrosinase family protein [Novosphingobium sp.]
MVHTRRNMWTLPANDQTLLWYGRAIAAMQAKPRRDPGSWGWQAAIHGWRDSIAAPGEQLPSAADRRRYWNQCQHGSWYFLPWHRGYLAAFEQIVRVQVVRLGGPESWALPYWDVGRTQWQRIRPEFLTPQRPDGSPNPLYVAQRRPGFQTGNVGIVPAAVDPRGLLLEPEFGGATAGGAPGFGGPQTDFFHGPGTLGALEGQIHNHVHSRVAGFMGSFEFAGLDPLFWLHHCNVDRLWEVWRARDLRHRDPLSTRWRNGPTAQKFIVRDAAGQPWTFTAQEMRNTRGPRLDYVYEDISDPLAGVATPGRLQPFAADDAGAPGARAVTGRRRRKTRVLGAVAPGVSLGGGRSTARVSVSAPPAPRGSLRGFAADEPSPAGGRVLLNLENITGVDPSQTYKVFVDLPDDHDPATDERNLVGVMSLFGVDSASDPQGDHAGNGLTYVFDITELAGARGEIDAGQIRVDFVPSDDDTPADSAHVGRISNVRETP